VIRERHSGFLRPANRAQLYSTGAKGVNITCPASEENPGGTGMTGFGRFRSFVVLAPPTVCRYVTLRPSRIATRKEFVRDADVTAGTTSDHSIACRSPPNSPTPGAQRRARIRSELADNRGRCPRSKTEDHNTLEPAALDRPTTRKPSRPTAESLASTRPQCDRLAAGPESENFNIDRLRTAIAIQLWAQRRARIDHRPDVPIERAVSTEVV
jgi:hypothetical protein